MAITRTTASQIVFAFNTSVRAFVTLFVALTVFATAYAVSTLLSPSELEGYQTLLWSGAMVALFSGLLVGSAAFLNARRHSALSAVAVADPAPPPGAER
jgi:hypothetical protein